MKDNGVDMNVTSPRELQQLLKENGLAPLKQLGQNFLVDHNIIRNIVAFSGIDETDCCLEIGPGVGALTAELCRNAKKVLAIEIDKGLVGVLQKVLLEYTNVEVVHADALKFDLGYVVEKLGNSIKVAANLPYYITSPVIFKLLEMKQLRSMTVMVQKEVAQRIQSQPGSKEYGALSVLVQYRCAVTPGFKVPPDCFYPRPNVDSYVLKMEVLDHPQSDVEPKKFAETVWMAFSQRRKTLINNLAAQTGMAKDKVGAMIERAGLDPGIRAEQLSIDEFSALAKSMDISI